MPNSTIIPDDDQDQDLSVDVYGESALATMEPDDATGSTAEWTGARCEKCAAPIKSDMVNICKSCGWYPSLGRFVEVDPNWETETKSSEATSEAKPVSHLGVWIKLIPRWGWIVVASMFLVVVESVVVRLATPSGSSMRTMWSLCQLALGILAAVGCHAFNFLVLAADDADVGLLDLFLKPIRLWARALQNLPTRLWVVDTAACGLMAALMSVVVIGGIPYERFWDWGFEEPVKQNLMGAVMDRAKELDSRDESLEEAIGDFAGKGGIEDSELPREGPKQPRNKLDCVILGFQIDRDNRISSLCLGAAHRGQLRFVGHVTPNMVDDELETLRLRLMAIRTRQAFIPVEAEDVVWVKPKYTCRVRFNEQQKNGRLREPQWDKMLGAMEARR